MRIAEERVTEPFNASGALENLKMNDGNFVLIWVNKSCPTMMGVEGSGER